MRAVIDIATAVLLVLGAFMCFAAGVGVLRFSDVLSRLHSATKPQILGLVSILLAVALQNPSLGAAATLVLVLAFQMLTAPVSAHMVARAAYRNAAITHAPLMVDELATVIERIENDETDVRPHEGALQVGTPGRGALHGAAADDDAEDGVGGAAQGDGVRDDGEPGRQGMRETE